ncbi:hypothetical protein GCM10011609_84980 [Lentzea pudingi]|uniref:Oxidoreductase n=1 Tax=Lentzea pudingi TaxID=1789439 RepID=A0ABQ2IVL8_9PSEU|nr:DoxX family protein [Lentzea pudingi]GGN28659.1 hypothetical protein GCM10011609_84980 [Lentzea pudingi]
MNDIGLLALRLVVATVFIVAGAASLFEEGIDANIEGYQAMGIPLPALSAAFTAYVEFFGGLLFVLGVLTRLVSAGFIVVMAGAMIFVHADHSLLPGPDGPGSALALVMGVASIAFILTGPGRFSLDHYLIAQRKTGSRQHSRV